MGLARGDRIPGPRIVWPASRFRAYVSWGMEAGCDWERRFESMMLARENQSRDVRLRSASKVQATNNIPLRAARCVSTGGGASRLGRR